MPGGLTARARALLGGGVNRRPLRRRQAAAAGPVARASGLLFSLPAVYRGCVALQATGRQRPGGSTRPLVSRCSPGRPLGRQATSPLRSARPSSWWTGRGVGRRRCYGIVRCLGEGGCSGRSRSQGDSFWLPDGSLWRGKRGQQMAEHFHPHVLSAGRRTLIEAPADFAEESTLISLWTFLL